MIDRKSVPPCTPRPHFRAARCLVTKARLVIVLAGSAAAAAMAIAYLPTVPAVGAQTGAPAVSGRPLDPNAAFPSVGADGSGGVLQNEFVSGELLVGFYPGSAARKGIDSARLSVGASTIREFREIKVQHWRLPRGLDVERAVEILSSNPNVRFAEPNYIVSSDDIPFAPNDAMRSDLWGLHNLGQSGGTLGADINAPEAWAGGNTGSANVVIGVIDSGIDYTHPDLDANIWVNPNETPGNNFDDDGNGYVDDVRGWDFVNNDNDPMDDNGHGTHVAGTIGAEGDNGSGVVGVNWNVRLMPLKFLAANGSGDIANAISAVLYAAKFKSDGANVVRITNNSWGGGRKSSAMQDAIANSGSLFVAAAGNGGTNQLAYPAGYNNVNVLSVAATDHNDNLATFSNYSSNWVDLAAPGVNIVSTYKGGQYRSLNGTSMASPHVAGAAGLVLAGSPGLSVAQLKAQLMDTVDQVPSLAGKSVTGGRLNLGRAVNPSFTLTDGCTGVGCSPADLPPGSLTAGSPTSTTLTLSWIETGDDGSTGTPYLADVRYSTAGPITAANFAQATVANREPVPGAAGAPETFVVTGLKPSTTYHFAMRIADEVGNYSGLHTATGTTEEGLWATSVVEDVANDVGFYSSLAYDPSLNPAIGYSDTTADDVKLARWNGSSWDVSIVDATAHSGVDLAFNPTTGHPSLTYGWGKMRFTEWNGSSWQTTILESRNAYNDVTSQAYDPISNQPSVSYRTSTNSGRGEIKFARRTNAGWVIQTVATAGARYNSLAYKPGTSVPSIAFSDDANGDNSLDTLKFATWNGTGWAVETVETGVNGYGVMASLAFDGDVHPAITHVAGLTVRLMRRDSSGNWYLDGTIGSGTYASLIYNGGSDDSFYISHVQTVDSNVAVARHPAALGGGWSSETVSFGDRIRWIIPQAVSPVCGIPSLAFSTGPNNDLRFATKCSL